MQYCIQSTLSALTVYRDSSDDFWNNSFVRHWPTAHDHILSYDIEQKILKQKKKD